MALDLIGPSDKPTGPIDIPRAPQVCYDDWDIWADMPTQRREPGAALPGLEEAMAENTRHFRRTRTITSIVAAQSVNHHIAGNAFAAMAQRNGIGLIAQQLHETNRQSSRELVFQQAVGSVRSPPQTSINTGVVVGSLTSVHEGAALERLSTGGSGSSVRSHAKYPDPELPDPALDRENSIAETISETEGDSQSLADLRTVLSSSPISRSSSSDWDTTAANSPLPSYGHHPFDGQTETIPDASPVSQADNEFSRPHVRLRELTRLSMIIELDRATGESEEEYDCTPPPELLIELSPPSRLPSPKPLSIRQRQEAVRSKMKSSLGQREESQREEVEEFAEGPAHSRLLQQSQHQKIEKRGLWSKIKSLFTRSKKEPGLEPEP